MVLIDNQQIKTGEGAHRVLTVVGISHANLNFLPSFMHNLFEGSVT